VTSGVRTEHDALDVGGAWLPPAAASTSSGGFEGCLGDRPAYGGT
jgi:hypothetical protein